MEREPRLDYRGPGFPLLQQALNDPEHNVVVVNTIGRYKSEHVREGLNWFYEQGDIADPNVNLARGGSAQPLIYSLASSENLREGSDLTARELSILTKAAHQLLHLPIQNSLSERRLIYAVSDPRFMLGAAKLFQSYTDKMGFRELTFVLINLGSPKDRRSLGVRFEAPILEISHGTDDGARKSR